jgi:hypothetical protein
VVIEIQACDSRRGSQGAFSIGLRVGEEVALVSFAMRWSSDCLDDGVFSRTFWDPCRSLISGMWLGMRIRTGERGSKR